MPRRAQTVRAALVALGRAGFSFEAGGEPFLDLDDAEVLSNLVSRGASVVALSPTGARVDLMLSMSGFGFDEMVTP